jgi:hypothetical protein
MKRPIKRALISVYDKSGLIEFAKELHAHGVEIVSTGSTAATIAKAGIPVVVDKPMGRSVHETELIINASHKAAVPITSFFNRLWDSDALTIKKIVATDFHENSTNEVVDAVLLWFREDDGDLVDELMDAMAYLTETGPIWVLTPKVGRNGHVEPSDIQDAAPIAGLSVTSSLPVASDWTATKLVARKSTKK